MPNQLVQKTAINPDIYVDDFGDHLKVFINTDKFVYQSLDKINLYFNENELSVYKNGDIHRIWFNEGDSILITVKYHSRNLGVRSEIYRQRNEELLKITDFYIRESLNDVKDSYSYKLVALLAERIKDQFKVDWKYSIDLDDHENLQLKYSAVVGAIFLFSLLAAVLLSYYL